MTSYNPHRLVYAIGDVHGRLDLLEQADAMIEAHRGGRDGQVIFLGDYVDRGPDSRGVVDWLIRAEHERAVICLKGNHEDMMVKTLLEGDRSIERAWMSNGGIETLESYGDEDVPQEHLTWLDQLPRQWSDGQRLYVHAGLYPGLPIAEQTDNDFLWIRERFLRAYPGELPIHVVHGHTPFWEGKPDAGQPELLPHRTNLDTGAYYTSRLSIGVFDRDHPGGPVEVLTAKLGDWSIKDETRQLRRFR